jgi:predicted transcriptional regulator
MSRKVVCCRDDEELAEAAQIMQENNVSALLVVDRKERPTGIISFGDVIVEAVFMASLESREKATNFPMN